MDNLLNKIFLATWMLRHYIPAGTLSCQHNILCFHTHSYQHTQLHYMPTSFWLMLSQLLPTYLSFPWGSLVMFSLTRPWKRIIKFHYDFNSFYPTINLSLSAEQFLNVMVEVHNEHMNTTFYPKPIDHYQCLHASAFHLEQTTKPIIFTLTIILNMDHKATPPPQRYHKIFLGANNLSVQINKHFKKIKYLFIANRDNEKGHRCK